MQTNESRFAGGLTSKDLPDSNKPMRMANSTQGNTVKHSTLKRVDRTDAPGNNRHERNQAAKRQRKADMRAIKRMEKENG